MTIYRAPTVSCSTVGTLQRRHCGPSGSLGPLRARGMEPGLGDSTYTCSHGVPLAVMSPGQWVPSGGLSTQRCQDPVTRCRLPDPLLPWSFCKGCWVYTWACDHHSEEAGSQAVSAALPCREPHVSVASAGTMWQVQGQQPFV